MSPLAETIYASLRSRLSSPADPRITYGELARQLRDTAVEFDSIFPRSPELYAALREIGQECRRLDLPPLPALVVRADTRRPGLAYYGSKDSQTSYKGEQIAAWRRDLEAVQQTTYPARY